MSKIEEQALKFAAEENWEQGIKLFEQLAMEAPDEDSRAKWQKGLQYSREQIFLERKFKESASAISVEDWSSAERSLLEILVRRPSYQRNGLRISHLFDLIVHPDNRKSLDLSFDGYLSFDDLLQAANLSPEIQQQNERKRLFDFLDEVELAIINTEWNKVSLLFSTFHFNSNKIASEILIAIDRLAKDHKNKELSQMWEKHVGRMFNQLRQDIK